MTNFPGVVMAMELTGALGIEASCLAFVLKPILSAKNAPLVISC